MVKFIIEHKDPVAKFRIGAPELKLFNIEASILISNGFEFKKVKPKVQETLKNKFSFDERQFGQQVTISEVISVIQSITGVAAVRINHLHLTKDTEKSIQNLIPSKVDTLGRY